MVKKIKLKGKKRWRVLFRDKKWLAGIYIPEFTRRSEIKELEKHAGPELFCLLEGRIRLVIKDNREVREIEMKKGEIIALNCWHNAYCPGGASGKALVMEKTGNSTILLSF